MAQTGCIIEGKKIHPNGVVSLLMRNITSTRNMLHTNELPNILHTIARSGVLQEENAYVGFDYVLDFPMVEQDRFPYVLDFKMTE